MIIFDIRRAAFKDISLIAHLWQELITPFWTEEMIEASFVLPTSRIYVAMKRAIQENRPILWGFIVGSLTQYDAEIYAIAVKKQVQHNKVGSKLLKKFEEDCAKAYSSNIFLEVSESNEKAQEFYKKKGYILFGKREKYYKNHLFDTQEDAFIFHKVLENKEEK